MNGNNSAATTEPEGASFQFKLANGNGTQAAVAEPPQAAAAPELEPQPLAIPGTKHWNSDSLKAQVDQNNAGLRERVLTRLEHMDSQKLAGSISAVLTKLGYAADNTPKVVDGELEFTGTLVVGGAITSRLAVHVRRQGGAQLGVDAVRALRGCLELEEQGLLITTGDFSDAARAEATAPGRRSISLMNGTQLATLMLDYEIGVEATTLKVYDVTLD